ncbi:MAG: hypothetical protein ACI4KE_03560 [Anaerovoracaceae bacterium]
MAKETVYITARSAEPKDVYDAVAGWTAGFDTLNDAKAHGLTPSQRAIVELKLTDNDIQSENDIKVVFETKA